jgi:hypothetical protein
MDHLRSVVDDYCIATRHSLEILYPSFANGYFVYSAAMRGVYILAQYRGVATNGWSTAKEDLHGGGTAETKEVPAGVFPQGGHKEVGIDDDDVLTTVIPANNNGNANRVDGSAFDANVSTTETTTAITWTWTWR